MSLSAPFNNARGTCAVVEQAGCCDDQGRWSLKKIVEQFLSTPRTQLTFYVSDLIHMGQQNELLSYKRSARSGAITRATMSNWMRQPTEEVQPHKLYETIAADLRLPTVQRAFFTYISSPGPYQLYAESENHDFQSGYQQLMPISTRNIVA